MVLLFLVLKEKASLDDISDLLFFFFGPRLPENGRDLPICLCMWSRNLLFERVRIRYFKSRKVKRVFVLA
jgi:hypothetical protein